MGIGKLYRNLYRSLRCHAASSVRWWQKDKVPQLLIIWRRGGYALAGVAPVPVLPGKLLDNTDGVLLAGWRICWGS
ncbi:UNVERIFIED_CONTAM: hypothetical protein Sindi_1891000 [Sesamum indicum]